MDDFASLGESLMRIDQQQVLRFASELSAASRRKLLGQIQSFNLDEIDELAQTHVRHSQTLAIAKDLQPATSYPCKPGPAQHKLYADAEARGNELLRQGKVGAFLVAGGQGTRLGYDGPKGEFPITPIKQKPLFQVFTEQLLAWSNIAQKPIAWYVMTSAANDDATRDFYKKHRHFGYDPENVFFFQQGMMPAFDLLGHMLLAEKDSLALSPDGHGGSLRALRKSGALDDMRRRGIEHLSYFQVDNPLVHCIDPLFIGLHEITGSEMSSKMIPKAGPLEKVGNFAIGDGKVQVIEYSDLPESLAKATNADGSLKFNAGSIAIHALRVSFIERLTASGRLELPWHRAEKKVPYIDEHGKSVNPDKPNAIKLEQFVFDAIPLAKNAIVFETDRAEEFSPVKNKDGNDSPETCRRDQIRRAARWLSATGINVAMKNGEPDATIEISPLFAVNGGQLAEKKPAINGISPNESIYLDNERSPQ